jgi:hypothetical protein
MKKIIISLIIFFLVFFFIGLFFSKKETSLKTIKETIKENKKEITTSSLLKINTTTESIFILDFEKKINEDFLKLTEKIKPDENKKIDDYTKELVQIQQKLKPLKSTQEIKPDILIEVARDLSKINPPPLLYSLHLELIKTYYKLGVALKEFSTTNDPVKKMLLYNLIKTTLNKIKL